MRRIPPRQREEMASDPFYRFCSLKRLHGNFGSCGGGVTWEHSIIYAGKQLNEKWSIIPLCEKHHGVNNYQDITAVDKEVSVWVALNRATFKDLAQISKAIKYNKLRDRLNKKYGIYNPKTRRIDTVKEE